MSSTAPGPVQAATGSPGVPGEATAIFTEDFENGSSATVDPPKLITDYVGATGMTYSAVPYWASAPNCNGLILSKDSAGTASPDLCGGAAVYENLKILSGKLSAAFGKPGDQFTVSSYTSGNGVAGEYTQIESRTPIELSPGGAYLTMSVDTGAYNCSVSGPAYLMRLSDAAGVSVPVVSDLISPCDDPNAIVDSADGKDGFLVRTVGDSPALIDSSSVILTLDNQNISGRGNDATIDNIVLWDASPQLDKAFVPAAITYGDTAVARFTITNVYSPDGSGAFTRLDAKPGWEFTDLLPDGLTVVGTPTTGAGAEACANFSADGTTTDTVMATGDLVKDQAYCVIEVVVEASAPGDYTNLASDVTTIGVKPPDNANLTVDGTPEIGLVKSALYTDVNDNKINDAGDTIDYNFVVTNLGNVPLVDLAISDPVVGAVTCESTTLGVGESTTCTADATYVITQADVDSGAKYNVATAEAANTFDPAEVVTATDNTTTPLEPNAKLVLVKSAAEPVDVNESGLTDAGDTIQYSFTVTNEGTVTMSDVRIDDPLAGAATCDTTTLAPGATANCVADEVYTITEADEAAGSVDNTATAFGTTPADVETPSNTDDTTTPVETPKPSLLFDKNAASPVDANKSGLTDAGDTIQYSFTVTNNGDVPLSNIAVTDDLAGSVTCVSTTLAPGASTACSADKPYVITDADEAAGVVNNVAFSSGDDPDGELVKSPTDATTTPVAVPLPSLLLEKFAAAPVDVNKSGITDAGDTIRYSFIVTNNGNIPVTGIKVVDDLAGPVSCATTDLPAGAKTDCVAVRDYVITSADASNGVVNNVANAVGVDPDGKPVTSNNDDTTTPVTKPDPRLTLTKEALDEKGNVTTGPVTTGNKLRYRFKVTNIGNVVVKNVTIADPMVGASTCEDTTLAPEQSTTCLSNAQYNVTAADSKVGSIKNTAVANGIDPNGAGVQSPPASVIVTTVFIDIPDTGMSVTKTLSAAAMLAVLGVTLVALSRRKRSAVAS